MRIIVNNFCIEGTRIFRLLENDPVWPWGRIAGMGRPTRRLRRGVTWRHLLEELCGIFWPRLICGHKDARWVWRGREMPTHASEEGNVESGFSLACFYCPQNYPFLKTFPEVVVLMAYFPKHRIREYLSTCYRQGPGPGVIWSSEENMSGSLVEVPRCQGP